MATLVSSSSLYTSEGAILLTPPSLKTLHYYVSKPGHLSGDLDNIQCDPRKKKKEETTKTLSMAGSELRLEALAKTGTRIRAPWQISGDHPAFETRPLLCPYSERAREKKLQPRTQSGIRLIHRLHVLFCLARKPTYNI